MHNTPGVQIFESPEPVSQRGADGGNRHLAVGETLGEAGLHQLHDDPAPVPLKIVNGDDVRMAERGQKLSFLPEPLQLRGVFEVLLVDFFDGDFPPQLLIEGAVHLGKTAVAQGFQKFVPRIPIHKPLPLASTIVRKQSPRNS